MLLAPLSAALAEDAAFEPPLRVQRDPLRIGAVLFDHPAVSIADAGSASFHVCWAAMREWLALDLAAALRRLGAMAAGDPRDDAVVRASGTAPFAYDLPQDHNLSFLIYGYLGPGYWRDYYLFRGDDDARAV